LAFWVDFYALHLLRDPRAAAYSWSKNKPQPDTDAREHMVRFSPTKSSALWDSWNASAEEIAESRLEEQLRTIGEAGAQIAGTHARIGFPDAEIARRGTTIVSGARE
jgi:hypothetical protein